MKNNIKISNIQFFVNMFIEKYVKDGYICIDGTLGNGNDTKKLKDLLGYSGHIYAFDIQNIAIENSRKYLYSNFSDLNNISFIQDNHVNVNLYINSNIDFYILNLGYLPGGDKSITTNYLSTISFIDSANRLLRPGRIGIVVIYPGHEEGYKELTHLYQYLENLSQKEYTIINFKYVNQINNPPQIIIIERI